MRVTKTGRALFDPHRFFTLKRKSPALRFSNSLTSKRVLCRKERPIENIMFSYAYATGTIVEAVGTGRNKKDAIKYAAVDACMKVEAMVLRESKKRIKYEKIRIRKKKNNINTGTAK